MKKFKNFVAIYFNHLLIYLVMMLFLTFAGSFFYSIGLDLFAYGVLIAMGLVLLGLLLDYISFPEM